MKKIALIFVLSLMACVSGSGFAGLVVSAHGDFLEEPQTLVMEAVQSFSFDDFCYHCKEAPIDKAVWRTRYGTQGTLLHVLLDYYINGVSSAGGGPGVGIGLAKENEDIVFLMIGYSLMHQRDTTNWDVQEKVVNADLHRRRGFYSVREIIQCCAKKHPELCCLFYPEPWHQCLWRIFCGPCEHAEAANGGVWARGRVPRAPTSTNKMD
jgi:hypothetical protein